MKRNYTAPDMERLERVEKLQITYPRLERLIEQIAHCHEFSKIAAEPQCLFITGDMGVGKTKMTERYERQHPRYETEDGTVVPILNTAIPVPATVKGLATVLLKNLGDPAATKGTVVSLTFRLQKLIKDCRVELIILDEFQHVIDRESLKILLTVSDWLKMLLNETKVPLVLIGMPSSTTILEANPQLRRRFAAREKFEPFGWKSSAQINEFRMLLKMIEDCLPLDGSSKLADTSMAYRFHCASGGFIHSVMKLVRYGTGIAIKEGADRLTLDILAAAYDKCLAADMPDVKNPFAS
jgi:hypothetical protein